VTKPQTPEVVNEPASLGPWAAAVWTLVLLAALTTNAGGAFVFDDRPNITENPAVTRFDPAHLQSWKEAAFGSPARFRPLPYLSFALQWKLSGSDPFGYHVVSDLLHALAALALLALLFEFLRSHGPDRVPKHWRAPLAAAGALLWALHPAQTQAVTYIVQRMSVMAGLFSFTALWLYLVGQRKGRILPYALAGLSYLLALASKESAAALPAIVILYEWFFPVEEPKKARQIRWGLLALALLPPLLLAGAYAQVSHQHFALGKLPGRDFTLWERILSAPRVYAQYFILLIFPRRLALDHGMSPSRGLLDPWTTLPAILLFVAILAATFAFRKQAPRGALALLAFLVALAPESTFLNLELFYEHRLYFPSAFALSLVPAGLALAAQGRSARTRNILTAGFLLALLALAARAGARNLEWSSAAGLLASNARAAPSNGRVYYNWGQELVREKKFGESLPKYTQAEKLGYTEAPFALGAAYQQLGKMNEAVAAYGRALQVHPRPAEVWINLGLLAKQGGDAQKAEECYLRAVALDPSGTQAFINLGNLYLQLGRDEEAANVLSTAVENDPARAEAYFNRIIAYIRLGEMDGAFADWESAKKLGFAPAARYDQLFAPFVRDRDRREALRKEGKW